jgi:hypothetical protein
VTAVALVCASRRGSAGITGRVLRGRRLHRRLIVHRLGASDRSAARLPLAGRGTITPEAAYAAGRSHRPARALAVGANGSFCDGRSDLAVPREGAGRAPRPHASCACDRAGSNRSCRIPGPSKGLHVCGALRGMPRARACLCLSRHGWEADGFPFRNRAHQVTSLYSDGALDRRSSDANPTRGSVWSTIVLTW